MAEEIQVNQNGGANAGVGDSAATTIEYLRARLHSERSVSKATRERANELAKRVAELEEQLKIASLQRKKAENATLDVLAFLENYGISDISDDYDSDSGLEESLYEPNVEKGNSVKEENSFVSSKQKEGSSGSEHENASLTGRSLSWKSSKDSPHSCERRYFDPSIRKHGKFVQYASSRHRAGKSCRQVKRREIRSTVEESRHESASPDLHVLGTADNSIHIIDGLDPKAEEPRKCSQNNVEKALLDAQILASSEAEGQISDASIFIQKRTCNREMERALQHQAHLIGRHEAEEKAQREWEEKYMGNGYNMQDSCEPGNQSDVTEERDATDERFETKALAPSPTETVFSNSNCHKSKEEVIRFGKGSSITHIDSFKFSPNAATESSHNFKAHEMRGCRTAASDFAFPVVNETQVLTDNHIINPPAQSSPSQPRCDSPHNHTASSSNGGDNYDQAERTLNTKSNKYAIVPHEGSQKLGGVLGALQQAKQMLERNISELPAIEVRAVGKAAETSVSAMKDVERAKMAVGSAGLFRVPTDFQFEASGHQTTLPGSHYSLRSSDYHSYSNVPLTRDDQYLLHSIEPRPSSSNQDRLFSSMPSSTEFRVSSSKPGYVMSLPSSSIFTTYSSNSTYPDMNPRLSSSELFAFQSRSSLPSSSVFTTYSSNSTYPDMTPRLSSSEPFTFQSPSRTPGVPPSGNPLLYNDHIRPNMYR